VSGTFRPGGIYRRTANEGDWYTKGEGASVGSLSMVLSKEFVVLVIIAFVPGLPLRVGLFAMAQWICFRIPIDPLIFMARDLLAMVIS